MLAVIELSKTLTSKRQRKVKSVSLIQVAPCKVREPGKMSQALLRQLLIMMHTIKLFDDVYLHMR